MDVDGGGGENGNILVAGAGFVGGPPKPNGFCVTVDDDEAVIVPNADGADIDEVNGNPPVDIADADVCELGEDPKENGAAGAVLAVLSVD